MMRGFSLVELSIVLVILGLLAGGVLAGQSLIRAAELRSVVTDYESYKTAVHTFREKYFELPGDALRATQFWGQSTACAGASATGVCNGNGDGKITAGNLAAGALPNEAFMFWSHLASAGLIAGQYTGIAGAARGDDADGGSNVPSGKIQSSVWFMRHRDNADVSCCHSTYNYGNVLFLGGEISAWPTGKILRTEDAWNIDNKTDDGHASRGNVWAVHYRECTLADDTVGTGTDHLDYDLQRTDLSCGLLFRTGL